MTGGVKAAFGWSDYEVIATGGGEKLERWGELVLLRPDPQVQAFPLGADFSPYAGHEFFLTLDEGIDRHYVFCRMEAAIVSACSSDK